MDSADKTTATCPVMGYEIDKAKAEAHGLVREINGKKVYLCCDHCIPAFDANPEKYLKKSEDV